MRAVTIATVIAMTLPPFTPAAAQSAGGRMYDPNTSAGVGQQLISCQSFGGRYQECRLPDGTQNVQIAQEFSRGECMENRTWGRRGGNIWVQGGCRATFAAYQGGYPGNPNPGYPGQGSGGYAGQLTCEATRGDRYCAANTQNRVDILRINRGQCQPGRDWTYDERGIRVSNNCRAVFGYGFANAGYPQPQPPVYPGYPGQGGQGGYAQVVNCESRGFGQNYCAVNTQNRVDVVRVLRGQCQPGRDWTYDERGIRVMNNCSAQFGVGFAGNQSGQQQGGGNAGAIIGGGILAAGLIALLASRGKSGQTPAGSAQVTADYNQFPQAARDDARACMAEAARQIGQTGGRGVALVQVDGASREGGGWRILARLNASYPTGTTPMSMTCLSANGRVTNFDVR